MEEPEPIFRCFQSNITGLLTEVDKILLKRTSLQVHQCAKEVRRQFETTEVKNIDQFFYDHFDWMKDQFYLLPYDMIRLIIRDACRFSYQYQPSMSKISIPMTEKNFVVIGTKICQYHGRGGFSMEFECPYRPLLEEKYKDNIPKFHSASIVIYSKFVDKYMLKVTYPAKASTNLKKQVKRPVYRSPYWRHTHSTYQIKPLYKQNLREALDSILAR